MLSETDSYLKGVVKDNNHIPANHTGTQLLAVGVPLWRSRGFLFNYRQPCFVRRSRQSNLCPSWNSGWRSYTNLSVAKEDSNFQFRDQTVSSAENAALEYVLILLEL